MDISYTKKTLPNGLRLLLAPLEQTQAVTVLMLTKVGSRYETATNNGVSHFLEHMMFKGTAKRPMARDVAKELDRLGADYNAFTSKDATGYYVKLAREHLDTALDIIADMLWHSKFAEEEIARERNVIVEEINMYHDNPMMLLEDVFEELVFGAEHPLGRHIAGPREVIKGMTRKMIVNYFQSHYFPSNMVLSIAGGFRPASATTKVRRLFNHTQTRRPRTRFRPFRNYQKQPQVMLHVRETEQVQLGLGVPALPYHHKDQAALSVLSVILGGNMSSRLFSRVREREGLCYHISASRSPYQDTGTFFIRSGLDKQRILPALELIMSILHELVRDGVTDEELANGKEFLKGKLTLGLEDSEEIADFFAKQELLIGKVSTPAQRLRAIAKVTKKDVQRVAKTLFRPSMFNLAVIGPFRDKAPFLKILNKTRS